VQKGFSMIDIFLGRLLTEKDVLTIELDTHKSGHVSFQQGVKLLTYIDRDYKEVFLSASNLDSQLRALTIVVEDQQGVLTAIAGCLGNEKIDITECGYFAIGSIGVNESIFRHSTSPTGVMTTEIQMATISRKLKDLQWVRQVYPQSVNEILPILDNLHKCDGSSQVVGRKLKLAPGSLEELGLGEGEHLCIVTSYMRFPMIIIRILSDLQNISFIGADIADKPLTLAHFCDSIKEDVNIIGLSVHHIPTTTRDQLNKARVRIFCKISGQASCEQVKTKILGINSNNRTLVDVESLQVINIDEYAKLAFKDQEDPERGN